jgi:hypothetical protein
VSDIRKVISGFEDFIEAVATNDLDMRGTPAVTATVDVDAIYKAYRTVRAPSHPSLHR